MLRARAYSARVSAVLVSLLFLFSFSPLPVNANELSASSNEELYQGGIFQSDSGDDLSFKGKKPAPQQLGFPYIPDPSMTTGSLCDQSDPDYETDRYSEGIPYCKRNVASSTKTSIYIAYGVKQECRKTYTIDHFIPLSIGGTNRVDNLWPESKAVKALRPQLEQQLYARMEKGRITQDEAVRIIVEAKLKPDISNPNDLDICY